LPGVRPRCCTGWCEEIYYLPRQSTTLITESDAYLGLGELYDPSAA